MDPCQSSLAVGIAVAAVSFLFVFLMIAAFDFFRWRRPDAVKRLLEERARLRDHVKWLSKELDFKTVELAQHEGRVPPPPLPGVTRPRADDQVDAMKQASPPLPSDPEITLKYDLSQEEIAEQGDLVAFYYKDGRVELRAVEKEAFRCTSYLAEDGTTFDLRGMLLYRGAHPDDLRALRNFYVERLEKEKR